MTWKNKQTVIKFDGCLKIYNGERQTVDNTFKDLEVLSF